MLIKLKGVFLFLGLFLLFFSNKKVNTQKKKKRNYELRKTTWIRFIGSHQLLWTRIYIQYIDVTSKLRPKWNEMPINIMIINNGRGAFGGFGKAKTRKEATQAVQLEEWQAHKTDGCLGRIIVRKQSESLLEKLLLCCGAMACETNGMGQRIRRRRLPATAAGRFKRTWLNKHSLLIPAVQSQSITPGRYLECSCRVTFTAVGINFFKCKILFLVLT